MGIDQPAFEALFYDLYDTFRQDAGRLNALDSMVGDGDHGDTMLRGFQAAAQRVSQGGFPDIGALFEAVANTLAEAMGGAIGPLLGAFFAEGGRVFSGVQHVTLEALSAFISQGRDAIVQVGGARPGDKTLLDALQPAVDALRSSVASDVDTALAAAVHAAEEGAQRTQDISAGLGRARFIAARSVGHLDPGAVSFVLILKGFHAAAQGLSRPAPDWGQSVVQDSHPRTTKFLNLPEQMVSQDNQGLALAYPGLVKLTEDGILIRAQPKAKGKVGMVIGHGGGHTPSMGGFIGPGLLDADVYGPLFTCASGLKIARAIALADHSAGVVLLVSNHAGDVLNARLAERRAAQLGIPIAPVLSSDDVATAPRTAYLDRRGLGGLLFALKVGGGAAESGLSLTAVADLMRRTNQRTATLAVASHAPRHPVSGEPLFALPPGEIEVGTGVHGEVGVYRGALMPAHELVEMMLNQLLPDLGGFLHDRVWVFLNGSGGTSHMELHILYQDVHRALGLRGLQVAAGVVGTFFTTLEMGGFSLSLCALDEEAAVWWQTPASGAAFRWPIT